MWSNRILQFIRNLINNHDDGVNFQWGDRYIRAGEVIEGVGGKYWRDNGDGTITEFSVPRVRINSVIRGFINSEYDVKRLGPDSVKFNKIEEVPPAVDKINNGYFWTTRATKLVLNGNIVTVVTTDQVFESTYTP